MRLTVKLDTVKALYVTENVTFEFVMPHTTSDNKRLSAAIANFKKLGYASNRQNTLVIGVDKCSAEYRVELADFLTIAEKVK